MFAQIILHDLSKSLQSRAKGRKFCGPYRWAPSKAGQGRGFYTGPDGQCARHGAGFRLRLEDANAHISGRLSMTTGYFCDGDGDGDGDTLQPIIARLPRGRGFLAGWTMGEGMASALGASIFEDEASAAYEAHRMAERDAEASRNALDEADEAACEAAAVAAGWSRNAHNGYFVAPVSSEVRMADYSSWRELCDDNGISSQESDQSEDEEDSDDDTTGYGEGYGEFKAAEPVFPDLYSCNAFGARVCHIDGEYSVMDCRFSADAAEGVLEPGEEFEVCYNGGAILPGGMDNAAPTLAQALAIIAASQAASETGR